MRIIGINSSPVWDLISSTRRSYLNSSEVFVMVMLPSPSELERMNRMQSSYAEVLYISRDF